MRWIKGLFVEGEARKAKLGKADVNALLYAGVA